MHNIIPVVSSLWAIIIVPWLLNSLKNSKKHKQGQVAYSILFPVIGAADFVFFLAMAVLSSLNQEEIWIPLCCIGFALLGNVLILAYVNCRIVYDEEGFTVKGFFGTTRRYSYQDITKIYRTSSDVKLYANDRKITVDLYASGATVFIKYVTKKWDELHPEDSL